MTSLSIIQHKKHVRRFPVLLSLFAVIAIYIVPLISQLNMQSMDMDGLMMRHHQTNTQPLLTDKPTLPTIMMPSMPHNSRDTNVAGMHHSSAEDIADDDKFGLKAACGFCTLLFHLYWLAALTFVLPLIKPLPYPAILCWLRSSTLRQLYSRRRPRAPPYSPIPSYQ